MKNIFWIGAGVLVIGAVLAVISEPEPSSFATSAPARRALQVTAARGAGGMAFTNKESSDATNCSVEVPDGSTTWISSTAGVIPPTVVPSQTVRIAWDNFGSNGQRMPEYIGLNQKRFVISCTIDGSVLSTTVGYE